MSPSAFPTVTKAKSTTTTNIGIGNTCEYKASMANAVIAALKAIFPFATIDVLGFTENCASRFGRAAGDSVDLMVEIVSESTDSSVLPSNDEIISSVAQNSASIATIISDETGIDVTVTDVRMIENPSASPSISPTPTLSQKPTLSNKPSQEFFPSSSPTQSSVPTVMPTKPEDRTFNIVSSYKFDDSIRIWCLQARKGKPGSKFFMRPCTGGSTQKFYLDEYSQLRLRNRPTLCMIWRKKSLYLGKCALGTDTSKALFTYDQDKKSFVVQKLKSLYMVGVKEDKKYEVVRLFKQGGNLNDSVQSWSLQWVR